MEENGREVRLSDLFAFLLKRYKAVICVALLFLVFGVMFGLHKTNSAKNNADSIERILEEANDELADAESDLARAKKELEIHVSRTIPDTETDIERTRELTQQLRSYMQNSLYYAMDPLNCGVSRLTFSIVTGASYDSERITSFASAILFDEEVLTQVRDILDVDADLSYVRELLTVNDEGGGFFTIRVVFNDTERAEQAADYLFDVLSDRIKTTRNTSNLSLVSRFTGNEVDEEMSEKHNAVEDKLLSLSRTAVDLNEMLKDMKEQTRLLEKEVTSAEDTLKEAKKKLSSLNSDYPSDITTPKGAFRQTARYCVIFLACGLAVGILAVLCGGLFSGKMQTRNDLQSQFSYPVISVVPREKKYLFDRAICRLEGDPIVDYTAGVKAAAQGLLSVTGGKKACLVYSGGGETAKTLSDATEGKISVCGNILEDASAIKKLEEYDCVVIVEKRGLSSIDLIRSEVKLMETMGKEILGFILA